MHVALAAYRPSITELLGNSFNSPHDVAFGLSFRVELLYLSKRHGGKHGPCPSPEILCGKIHLSYLAQVFIDVVGVNASLRAIVIDVLEKLLPRQILAALDDLCESPIVKVEREFDAAFAAKCELNFRSLNFDMLVAHGGQSKRTILLGVFFIADSDQRRFEKLHNGRNDFCARQARAREVLLDLH